MEALDHLFRRERARTVAALYRQSGNLDAAEEAFQEATVSALDLWPRQGTPDNPGAWLSVVAKNHLLQQRRHDAVVEASAPLLGDEEATTLSSPGAISDDALRLIFACCHPDLTPEAQVALTLKVVSGFTTEQLSRAFLCSEATMAQRIVRAKRTIEERKLAYDPPGRRDLNERIAAVLAVVYLVFNEGHTAHSGALIRVDLQSEALRLGRLLEELLPTEPDAFALSALMAFSVARSLTRTDAEGVLLLLSEQDRSRWDRTLITEGLMALQRARRLAGGGSYFLQAEIAACHATASTWEATSWRRIVDCYDALLALSDSPVVALNRTVAIMMRDGTEAALEALRPLEQALNHYHLFYATRAELKRRRGEDPGSDYRRALELATNESERRFLERRIRMGDCCAT